jgi:hypothetical protein
MSQTTPTNSDQSAVSTKAFVTEEGRTIDYQGDYDAYLVEHREELERFRNERSAFTPHYELDEDMWKGEGYRPTETGDESCKLDINALNIKLKAMDVINHHENMVLHS